MSVLATILVSAWLGASALFVAEAVSAIVCGIAQFGVGSRIAALRAEIGPSLQALAVDDPRRVAFGQLHAFSVAWLGVAMLAAAVVIVAGALALRDARRTAS